MRLTGRQLGQHYCPIAEHGKSRAETQGQARETWRNGFSLRAAMAQWIMAGADVQWSMLANRRLRRAAAADGTLFGADINRTLHGDAGGGPWRAR